MRNLRRWCVAAAAVVLVACGGGSSDDDAAVPGTARLGAQGGTVATTDGASVEVPSGAFETEATVSITRDGTGAPALPKVVKPASAVYKITPHGGDFLRHVTVSIPVTDDAVPEGAQLALLTADPGDTGWRLLSAATYADGTMRAPVMQFSYFQVVTLTAVRMPLLQTEIFRVSNAGFPGAQQVPADYEIAGQYGTSSWTNNVDSLKDKIEAEARLRYEPVISRLNTATAAPRPCLPSDYGPAGLRWSSMRDGAPAAVGTSHFGTFFPPTQPWPRSLLDALAIGYGDRAGAQPFFASEIANRGSPQAGFGALHFYGQDSPRTGGLVESVPGFPYALPPAGNVPEDDHLSWHATVHLRPLDNGRWRFDAVVPTDCGIAVQAAPLSVRVNLQDVSGTTWSGGVLPVATQDDDRDDLVVRASNRIVDTGVIRTAVLGLPTRLRFVVTPSTWDPIYDPLTDSDPLRWTAYQELRSIAWEYSTDGRVWVTRPDLAAKAVPAPLRGYNGSTLPYLAHYDLSIDEVVTASAGYYRAFVCSRWLQKGKRAPLSALVETVSGCGAFGRFQVEVVSTPPSVTRQPASQTVLVGDQATLVVAADGLPAPAIQWEKRSFGDAFLNLPWRAIAGATAPTYTTPATTLADHPTYYRAVLTSAAGRAVSDTATVGVVQQLAPPVVTGQPGSLNVNVGGTAVFAATVSGAAPLSYQWRRNGANITGANSPVLTLTNVTALDDGQYTLAVSNRAGSVVSEPAALVVTLGTPVSLPPTIAAAPTSLSVPEGSAANFAVAVTGTGPYTYAWYRAGAPSPVSNEPVLAFPSVAAGDAGSYTVRVTNTVGTVLSSAATLTVTPGGGTPVTPSIVTPPVSVAAFPGAEAVYVVAATGTGPLAYQWRFNGNDIPGATAAVLRVPAVSGANAGQYSVEVRNGAGAALSGAVPLVVIGAPVIVTPPGAKSAIEGATATFEVAATGDLLRYQWTRNAVAIDGATSASYTTPTLALADSGAVYAVIVYNGAGLQFSAGAVLTVTAAPPPPALTQTTLASVTSAGGVPDNTSGLPTLSSNGRRVAFTSEGSNLVPGGAVAGGAYVRDLDTGTTVQVNRTLAGAASSRRVGEYVKISGNGRYVVFTSDDPDLVANDTNGGPDTFVRDLQAGSTVRVNVRADGAQVASDGLGIAVDISADGRYVLFQSASDLTGSGAPLPSGYRWFVRDLQLATVYGLPAFDDFNGAVLSGDGLNTAILTVDAGGYRVKVADREGSVRTVLTIPSADGYVGGRPALSHDGRYVAFLFRSATLLGGAAAAANQIGVIDVYASNPASTLELVSRTAGGLPGDGPSDQPILSADGRYVLFSSRAPLLTDGLGQACCGPVAVVRGRVANTTRVANRDTGGAGFAPIGLRPALSSDASTVAFGADIASVLGAGTLGGGQVFVAPRP